MFLSRFSNFCSNMLRNGLKAKIIGKFFFTCTLESTEEFWLTGNTFISDERNEKVKIYNKLPFFLNLKISSELLGD